MGDDHKQIYLEVLNDIKPTCTVMQPFQWGVAKHYVIPNNLIKQNTCWNWCITLLLTKNKLLG